MDFHIRDDDTCRLADHILRRTEHRPEPPDVPGPAPGAAAGACETASALLKNSINHFLPAAVV